MKTIRLVIEYEGTTYCGWQIQGNEPSVQQEIQKALARLTGEQIKVSGASRTDSGVHALGQVASFATDSTISPESFAPALNSFLPDDIVVVHSEESVAGFHAQHHAKWKQYRYTILNSPVPTALQRNYCWRIARTLDVRAMADASAVFEGAHDFSAFASHPEVRASAVRTVFKVNVRRADAWIKIDVAGDGFLHKMVRLMTGALVQVGRGVLTRENLCEIMTRRERDDEFPAAPAHGLCLIAVHYEDYSPERALV